MSFPHTVEWPAEFPRTYTNKRLRAKATEAYKEAYARKAAIANADEYWRLARINADVAQMYLVPVRPGAVALLETVYLAMGAMEDCSDLLPLALLSMGCGPDHWPLPEAEEGPEPGSDEDQYPMVGRLFSNEAPKPKGEDN